MSEIKLKIGNPTRNGTYVCYIEHDHMPRYPDKKLLVWHEGRWGYRMSDQFFRDTVLGWVGPLPTPSMDDLGILNNTNLCVKYAIGIMPDGFHGAFLHGPFGTLAEAEDEVGDPGQYIFELHLDQDAEVVRKWSNRKIKWLKKKNDRNS